jgi:hypothetical protein
MLSQSMTHEINKDVPNFASEIHDILPGNLPMPNLELVKGI